MIYVNRPRGGGVLRGAFSPLKVPASARRGGIDGRDARGGHARRASLPRNPEENQLSNQGVQLLMWNTRSVQLNVRLPKDVASEAEEVQRSDPDFLSRVIQYGLTRRSIYHRLREAEGRGAPAIGRPDDSGPGLLRP